ncbi:MAG: 2-C-methyl-D-erythritol 2,4-cyclodiphosphate synthase [Clostridia bacterium]|nr:2-C-methyl-D-erythritol 2,4-cyclodiphosphate synthase [Clostridia bacterium]
MKYNVILTAAGLSQRFGVNNKLLEQCGSSVVIIEAIKPFLEFEEVSKVIVAIHPSFSDEFLNLLELYKLDEDKRIKITRGGDSRTQTVKKALPALEDDCDYVLIHDAARPFVSKELIARVMEGAKEAGVCQPLIDMTDSIVQVKDGELTPKSRSEIKRVQTPICAETGRLLAAYKKCKKDFHDDIAVLQTYAKGPVKIVEGEKRNIKITFKEDLTTNPFVFSHDMHVNPTKNWQIADTIMSRTGVGYDIHRLQNGEGIKLLGVKIDCPFSFVAHSDGDVPVHAIMDAILSAIGDPDIGHLFPVNDPKFDGADSMELLAQVLARAYNKDFIVRNVSVCIIAEKPMIAPHIPAMKQTLSAALSLPVDHIGISATTNEQVGALGNSQAIAAFASVLLSKTV